MHSITLTLNSPTPLKSCFKPSTNSKLLKTFIDYLPNLAGSRNNFSNRASNLVCKSSYSSITDFDLYDLLGIDNSSDQSEIKQAYRALQKRCHPDIAGPAGHDMAIILNEAYAVLSDPLSRFSYDKEQAKVAELKGYTGKPIYSVWYGSQNEERAVFVDEVKCVGCLKCALIAGNTFAVESVYGRARVIAQWADSEPKIQEAIEACPVDCISMVDRSKLAALEFLMSKQPRGNVRIGAGNTVGTRVSNIFVDVDKFQEKYMDALAKGSSDRSKESYVHWESRLSAIQAIRSITNWLYWQLPIQGIPSSQTPKKLLQLPQNSSQSNSPNIKKLRDAANARKKETKSPKPQSITFSDEYWTPSNLILPESTKKSTQKSTSAASTHKSSSTSNNKSKVSDYKTVDPNQWRIPIAMGVVAAAIVKVQIGDGSSVGGIEEHAGGSLLVDVVNSSWLQVILAGVTWYLIGMAAVELVALFQIKSGDGKD